MASINQGTIRVERFTKTSGKHIGNTAYCYTVTRSVSELTPTQFRTPAGQGLEKFGRPLFQLLL
jgi:hypothetical protein